MRKFKILPLLLLLLTLATSAAAQKKTQKTYIPWSNGKLVVSEEGRYLKHENGIPFFWLGETGWLLPERLNRDEAEYYLEQCKRRGYNVIQVQTLNNVPSMNIYGQYSMTDGYNFKNINQKGVYGYWDHMDYIIRDFEREGLEERKNLVKSIVEKMNAEFGTERIKLKMWDQYYNMADELKKHMDIVDLARDAYRAEGLEINEDPVRGGTDGSQLTYMGLPCPNIFAGEENMHGRYEYTVLESMYKAVDVMIKIAELNAERAK